MSRNHMQLSFDAISVNEAFARMAAAAFLMELDPTMEELDDVKTAVSEAVTIAIIHGYPGGVESRADEQTVIPQVELICTYEGRRLTVIVRDRGVGIADIAQARQPFYTSKPELERSGMGFAFMEAFMDELQVESAPGKGTCVTMKKYIGGETYSDSCKNMEEKTENDIPVNCMEKKTEIVACEPVGEDA